MAHQKVTIINPLGCSPKYTYRENNKEPTQIDHSCYLASGSATTLIVDEPGVYGVVQNRTLELYEYNLIIHIYADPYEPQSSIRFCADIWQNGAKVLSRCKLQASAIPKDQPNARQKFTIRDDKEALIDFKERFGTDKFNVKAYSVKTDISTTNVKSLLCNETLDLNDEAKQTVTPFTWTAILKRPKVPYTGAQKTTDDDLKKSNTIKRTFSVHSLFTPAPDAKKPTPDAGTQETQAAMLTDDVTSKLL
jgi:hypothetical protein